MVRVGTAIRKTLERMEGDPNESDIYDSFSALCINGTWELERRLMRMRIQVNVAMLNRGKPGYDKWERESFIIIKRVL